MPPGADALPLAPDAMGDDALTEHIRCGERAAFQQLMERFGRLLFRIARGVVGDDAEAEDVVQEAFLHAFHKFDTFRGDAPLRTWLVSIALNEARSRLRKRHPMVGLEQINPAALDPYWAAQAHPKAAAGDPPSLVARAQIRRLLTQAIDGLPEPFRAVYVLRELHELSVEETAARLDLNPQTVKTRLHRARRLLRKALDATLGSALADTFPFLGVRCACLTATLMARLGVAGRCPPTAPH